MSNERKRMWDLHKIMLVMSEALERKAVGVAVDITYKVTDQLTGSQMAVCGDFDQDDTMIHIVFLTPSKGTTISQSAYEELKYQTIKTFMHELVHYEQACMGEDTLSPVGQSYVQYKCSVLEVEAYARVDIPNDLYRYGMSLDLQEYADALTDVNSPLSNEVLDAVYECLCYYDAPIDQYINDNERYTQ